MLSIGLLTYHTYKLWQETLSEVLWFFRDQITGRVPLRGVKAEARIP